MVHPSTTGALGPIKFSFKNCSAECFLTFASQAADAWYLTLTRFFFRGFSFADCSPVCSRTTDPCLSTKRFETLGWLNCSEHAKMVRWAPVPNRDRIEEHATLFSLAVSLLYSHFVLLFYWFWHTVSPTHLSSFPGGYCGFCHCLERESERKVGLDDVRGRLLGFLRSIGNLSRIVLYCIFGKVT